MVAVGPVVDEAVEMLRATLPSSNRIVWQRPPEPVSVLADGSELMQVLMNLGVNASQAFRDQRGNITFTLARASLGTDEAVRIGLEAGHYARISVQDDGIGMSEELRRRIFEPFFTTKGVGEGSGLGLSVAEGVIRGYQGVIEVDSKVGVGTTFSIFLPAADDAPPVQAEALPAPAETARGGGRRVLLLDDNDLVLATVRRILTRAGYSVTTHADPATALNELESNPCAFDLLITDRTMPGLSGPEVAQRARALNPDLPVVLLTGANQSADDEAPWFSAVVMKPVERAALLRTVDQLLVSKS